MAGPDVHRFTVSRVDEAEAHRFWLDSPHATSFTNPAVLGALSSTCDWWQARKGREPVCIWPVPLDRHGKVALPPFCYYVGPMWSRDEMMAPHHRALSTSLGVYEAFIAAFLEAYGQVAAELPVGLYDVRPFDWWNYHSPERGRFGVMPRYTAAISGLHDRSLDDITAGFRQVRRYEARRFERTSDVEVHQGPAPDSVVKLYGDIMRHQGISVEAHTEAAVHTLVELVREGHGEAFAVSVADAGVQAVVLMLFGNSTANLVLNLTSPQARSTGLPAWVTVQAIARAQAAGVATFDFNGANSPKRGDDKHSYGAQPQLFFRVVYP